MSNATKSDKRVRRQLAPVERRRKINDSEAKRLNRRAIANGAAAQGCSTMIAVALLAGLTVVAAAWRWAR